MPKISIQILPKLSELKKYMKTVSRPDSLELFSEYSNVFLLNRSATSLRVICEAIHEQKDNSINIWIPQYFCGETLGSIRNDSRFNLVFYPVTDKLLPDYKLCSALAAETSPDVFLFVHYFGLNMDIAAAKNFCKNNNCLLIEDCAHVIGPVGKYGQSGDFILFSFHKCLPVVDGAALCINNSSNINEEVIEYIERKVDSLPRYDSRIDYLKRFIKKVLHINAEGTYNFAVHYDNAESDQRMFRISSYSENYISYMSDKELRNYTYLRDKNLRMMNYIIDEYKLPVKAFTIADGKNSPYLAVYEIMDETQAETISRILKSKGIPMGIWTYLPAEIKETDAKVAEYCSKHFFTVPVHQNISEERIVNCFSSRLYDSTSEIDVVEAKEENEKWEELLKRAEICPITQDYVYGAIKAAVEKKHHKTYVLKYHERSIGCFQAIIKNILCFKLVRINKGPIIFDGYEESMMLQAIQAIKNKFSLKHLSVLIISPNVKYSPQVVEFMVKSGFNKLKYTNKFTAFVDLTQNDNEIRKSLKSKWRNQLKSADKHPQKLEELNDGFDHIISLYEKNMADKGFQGIPTAYLKEMICCAPQKIKIFGDYLDEELVAFDIAFIHGNTATYLVGWENDKGRNVYANNFLLFHMMLKLKQEGVKTFDLGGLGLISAPSIAKFKLGVSDDIYEYCGDYISFH